MIFLKRTLIFLVFGTLCLSCTGKIESQQFSEPTDSTRSVLTNKFIIPDSLSQVPNLSTDNDGHVYLSWVQSIDGLSTLKFSRLSTEYQWSAPQVISQGKDWFVNWADYPALATSDGQHMISHFLQKSGEGTFDYDVRLTQSPDSGWSWTPSYVLHDDQKKAEHGFASILPYGNDFFITWLDGRNTSESVDGHGGSMTLRAAIVNKAGQKLEEWQLDHRICDCCQTTAAITSNGPIVVYRDRSEDEVRDMSIARYVDGAWTSPVTIHDDNWLIKGCPVNGPKASVIGNTVVVGWFTASDGDRRVNLAFSNDGGATFTDPIRVDQGSAIGRVDVEMLNKNEAIISWMEDGNIVAAKVDSDGQIVKRYYLTSSSDSRSSGFPQIAVSKDSMVVAWTDSQLQKVRTGIFKY